jgi:hypothetical protein
MTATPEPPTPRTASDDASTSVASSGSAAPPPLRSRRRSVSSVAPASAPKPVAAPSKAAEAPAVEVELEGDDTGTTTTTRSRRRPKQPAKAATTQPAPRPVVAAAPVIRTERRYRHTITKVDLWTVLKLSLCFYVSAMFVTLIALVALWLIADAAGVIGSIENFLGDLLSAKDFTFLSGEVLRGAILVSLVVVAMQVVITVIAASFYNIFAELFGGLEITVREEEVSPR